MRQHPRPFIYALLVHLVLLAVLIFSLDWTSTVKPSTSRKHAPIQAVAVDARVSVSAIIGILKVLPPFFMTQARRTARLLSV